ncbi:MAG TPA: hypothetical protein PKD72_02115 [Gemmatales bacterium]|nr:hypothetical protein [Gemmatales bacterium]
MRAFWITLEQSRLLMACALMTLFSLLFLYIDHAPLWHTDIWAHLKLGSWISEHGRIPDVEPYSPFTEDTAWTPNAWLSQYLLYKVYEAGAWLSYRWSWDESAQPCGLILLRTFHALLLILRFLFLFWALERWGGSRFVAFLGVLLSLILSWNHLEVLRPQVFGELCMAIMLFMVSRKPPSRLATWCVPIVMAFWANMHGSYFNGLLILLGILFARFLMAVRKSYQGEAIYSPTLRRTFRMFFLSILLIGFCNPYGSFRWFEDTLQLAQNPNIRMMDEWQRLNWNSLQGQIFLGSLILVLLTQILAKAKRVAGISFGQGLLLLCFGLQTVFFQRMMPWWAIVCPFVCVGPWARIFQLVEIPAFRQSWLRIVSVLAVIMTGFWICFAFSTIRNMMEYEETPALGKLLHPGTPRLPDSLSKRRLAHKSDPQIHEALHRPGATIFASETLGDYLYYSGRIPVIVFTHVHLFSVDHWHKCMVVKEGIENWERYLEEWNVQLIMVEPELHPHLVEQVRKSPKWIVKLDETGSNTKPNPKSRHFIAIRK